MELLRGQSRSVLPRSFANSLENPRYRKYRGRRDATPKGQKDADEKKKRKKANAAQRRRRFRRRRRHRRRCENDGERSKITMHPRHYCATICGSHLNRVLGSLVSFLMKVAFSFLPLLPRCHPIALSSVSFARSRSSMVLFVPLSLSLSLPLSRSPSLCPLYSASSATPFEQDTPVARKSITGVNVITAPADAPR